MDSLVSRPHHARKERVWRWFLVLQAQQSCDYLHRFVLEHVRSHDGAQDQEKACNVPRPFPPFAMWGGVWGRDYPMEEGRPDIHVCAIII